MNKMSHLKIYTDGACSGNHIIGNNRKAGTGIVMVDEDSVVWSHSENVTLKISPEVTNNRSELYAIMTALDSFLKECEGFDVVTIHTDSMYAVNIFNVWLPNWKRSDKIYKNKDIIDKIDKLMSDIKKIGVKLNIVHIRGHSTNFYNNMADELAVKGTLKRTS